MAECSFKNWEVVALSPIGGVVGFYRIVEFRTLIYQKNSYIFLNGLHSNWFKSIRFVLHYSNGYYQSLLLILFANS